MNAYRDCCEDWIARAKRGGLSETEQRQFRELLASSLEARLLYEAGCAFDRESCVVAGDDARLGRIARKLQKRHRGRTEVAASSQKNKAAVRRTLGTPEQTSSLPGPRSAEQLLPEPPTVQPRQPAHSSEQRTEPVPTVSSDETSAVAPKSNDSAIARFDDIAETSAASATPIEIFTEANRVRVRGETAKAVSLYERLLSQFPQSREAATARISLGTLYLQEGRASQALVQFQTYDSVQGPLSAEAVWGEAQAYRALGQFGNERRAVERIVRDMPQSAYVTAAHRRLSE